MAINQKAKTIAVLGATGYIGGRLVTRLLNQGYSVKAIGRSIHKLTARHWHEHPNIELVECDVLNIQELQKALLYTDAVYYLVHSMNPQSKDFSKTDRIAAQNLIQVTAEVGVKQIIYLGGLGQDSPELSKHLRSRAEVAEILQSGKVPVTVLRAAMIIGSGSASFEILRYLVERLPLMITPKWVHIKSQPIAIRNVMTYLMGCLEKPEALGQTFDIGGPDIISYYELMQIYADKAKLKRRWVIPVPFFSVKLSSYWIHLVTPIPRTIAAPLAEGLKNPVICKENRIRALIPQELFNCKEAIELALERTQHNEVESHWLDAGSFPTEEWVYPGDDSWAGGNVYIDKRQTTINVSAEQLWPQIIRIGGKNGWYYGKWLWHLRGLLDLVFGGDGFARGRRHEFDVQAGDFIDCWRVVKVIKNQLLILRADMKVPGDAYLEFKLEQNNAQQTTLTQTARFVPRGLMGLAYWYLVTPAHYFVFNGMLTGIIKTVNRAPMQKV